MENFVSNTTEQEKKLDLNIEDIISELTVKENDPKGNPDADSTSEQSLDQDRGDLPENVTEKPRDDEHMDLTKIEGYKQWLTPYLAVSDDEGAFLGSPDIEKRVKEFCSELKRIDLENEEKGSAERLIQEIKDMILEYAPLINSAENTSIGIMTKYRIREAVA